VNADPKLNPPIRWQASVALGHAVLHLDGAANGIDDAPKLNEDAVTRQLDDAPVMQGNGRID
jgi:hypothetical protein